MTLVQHDQYRIVVDKIEQVEDMALSQELLTFMQKMQVSVDKISEDIIASKADLKKDIKESRKEVKEELSAMNKKMNTINEQVRKNKEEDDARFERLERRFDEFDEEKRKIDAQTRKRKDISEGMKADENTIGRVVKTKPGPDARNRSKSNTDTVDSYRDKVKNCNNSAKDTTEILVPEPVVFKSAWARQYSQVNLEEQLIAATEAAAKMEEQKEQKETKQRKIHPPTKPLKMGDSLELHSQQDWNWEDGDTDWEGTIDKQEKNREKKRRDREKKTKKVAKAINVAKCTIGIGPIATQSIDYFNDITADYHEAKKMAATEFLMGYLKFDHDDMEDLNISDTKISAKGDGILYLVLDHPDKVKDIRRRISDIQNKDVKTREYIPPHFFNRYTALGRHAQDLRAANIDIKTQIRFEETDIELYTKERGSDGPFQPVGINNASTKVDLPPIDFNAKWRRREDRPALRRVSPQNQKVTLKSLAGRTTTQKNSSGSPSYEPANKRSKHQMNKESSSSGSASDSEPDSPARRKTTDDDVTMTTPN